MANDRSEMQQLVRLTYAQAALDLHLVHGGLAERHIEQLVEHARAILAAHGVAPEGSKLGHLHGDLEGALSHIAAQAARPWHAARHQTAALRATRRSEDARRGRFELAMGLRQLRFGDASSALAEFAAAGSAGVDAATRDALLLATARAQRLSGRWDDAAATIAEAAQASPASAAIWRWEELMLEAARTGDPRPLAVATRDGKPHYLPAAILTATMLQLSAERFVDRKLTPRLETVIRRRDLVWSFDCPWTRAVRVLDAADLRRDDGEDPDAAELDAVLEAAPALPDVEAELLVWLAAARLLVRRQEFRMAGLALRRYRALSWSLSEGERDDALGLASGLLERSWFVEKKTC